MVMVAERVKEGAPNCIQTHSISGDFRPQNKIRQEPVEATFNQRALFLADRPFWKRGRVELALWRI